VFHPLIGGQEIRSPAEVLDALQNVPCSWFGTSKVGRRKLIIRFRSLASEKNWEHLHGHIIWQARLLLRI
jgi:hypothetical protein